jgi:serine/threonine-protein kinase
VPVPDDNDLTIGPAGVTRASTPASGGGTRTPAPGRFAPGSIIAGRYRLVALLGRGGMGEVYRADDLTLDQPVALKFLPEGVVVDDARLAQFHNELRTARQVSHKNVCRLYDLGDFDGRRFLTMEYVDGEDLGALLRRIGRFPPDKALDIARQLCAGVSAAHERGVLHRDLKPANVMLDGDGNVRITDFGIATAGMAGSDPGLGALGFAGTPQYMAPEQLAGKPSSIKSDIYALGLILFEIFTGRRAWDAKTINDLKSQQDTGTMTTPSSIVRDLDPAVERVILRCLSRDPDERPSTALTVAAALPGGDPLAAALAAGETPSPELLVAAAEREATPVALAISLAAAFVIGLAAFVVVAPRTGVPGYDALEKPPAVLADRAEQIFASLGYAPEDEADHASGFSAAGDYERWIEQTKQTGDRWEELRIGRPPAIMFWYRSSPRDLVALHAVSGVTSTDPPEIITMMRSVTLDTRGRLVEFHAVPPQVDADAPMPAPPSWKPLFDAAALDMSLFTPAQPEWIPHSFADTRAAWEGHYKERPDVPIRVEAAAYRGRATSFMIVGPWTRAVRMTPVPRTRLQAALSVANFAVYISLLVAAALIARRNVRMNRTDSRTAVRLAAWIAVSVSIGWAVLNHHGTSVSIEADQFFNTLGYGLFLGGTLWVLYLAAEPYVRRLWPDGLLGWTRFFAGHVRDPRVGRDILIGCVFGVVSTLIESARIVLLPLFGQPMPRPILGTTLNLLNGPHYLAGMGANWTYGPMQTSLVVALLFVGFRFLLRRNWAAFVASILVILAIGDNGQAILGGIGINTVFFVLMYATILVALVRFGLLVATTGLIVDQAITTVPFPARLSSWAGAPAIWTLVLVLALMAFGFYSSRAGQPLLGTSEN